MGTVGATAFRETRARNQARAPEAERSAEWRDRAACRSADPELFFPIMTVNQNGLNKRAAEQIAAAKKLCARCPVIRECDEWAESIHSEFGTFAGMDEVERNERRAVRLRASRSEVVEVRHKCVGCPTVYTPSRVDQMWCTAACRERARRQRPVRDETAPGEDLKVLVAVPATDPRSVIVKRIWELVNVRQDGQGLSDNAIAKRLNAEEHPVFRQDAGPWTRDMVRGWRRRWNIPHSSETTPK